MKHINWKERLNTVFVVQVILSVFVPVLAYFGISANQLTTWDSVGNLIVSAVSNPYVIGTMVVGLWNAINNPLTKGLGDKQKH